MRDNKESQRLDNLSANQVINSFLTYVRTTGTHCDPRQSCYFFGAHLSEIPILSPVREGELTIEIIFDLADRREGNRVKNAIVKLGWINDRFELTTSQIDIKAAYEKLMSERSYCLP